MPTLAPNSVHTAYITVNNSGGDAGVFIRGQVYPGGDVKDSAVVNMAGGAQAEIAVGPLTMPSAEGSKELRVEVRWAPTGTAYNNQALWTIALSGPVGEAVVIAAPVVPPTLSIASVRWS